MKPMYPQMAACRKFSIILAVIHMYWAAIRRARNDLICRGVHLNSQDCTSIFFKEVRLLFHGAKLSLSISVIQCLILWSGRERADQLRLRKPQEHHDAIDARRLVSFS